MSVHNSAHDYFVILYFIKKHVLFKWTKYDEESPIVQSRMVKANRRAKLGVPRKEITGGFDCIQIAVRYLASGI